MSSKRKVPAGIKAISEFFSPVPPKVNRQGQQSLQEENASTSEKSATSVPENTSSLEGNNNAAPTSLENVTAVSEERATTDSSIGLEENAIDSQGDKILQQLQKLAVRIEGKTQAVVETLKQLSGISP